MNKKNENDLTFAERAVEKLLLLGLSNMEIADELELSDKTVKFHLTNIYKKKNKKTRLQYIADYYMELVRSLEKRALPIGGL